MEKQKNSKILYVDTAECCEMVGLMLFQETRNVDFVGLSSSEEALKSIEFENFDLFIFEYNLPKISGIELCRSIRVTDSQTPILFYTVIADSFDRQIALHNGVTDYLVKPDDLNKLIFTIKKLS